MLYCLRVLLRVFDASTEKRPGDIVQKYQYFDTGLTYLLLDPEIEPRL